jgi:hypothetical protein
MTCPPARSISIPLATNRSAVSRSIILASIGVDPSGGSGDSMTLAVAHEAGGHTAEKYANHQPLNRQSEQCAREGIELCVDHGRSCRRLCGHAAAALIKAHVFAAERIHGDDTTVPVLAKVKTRTGRIWTYVRDDRPFGGGGKVDV